MRPVRTNKYDNTASERSKAPGGVGGTGVTRGS